MLPGRVELPNMLINESTYESKVNSQGALESISYSEPSAGRVEFEELVFTKRLFVYTGFEINDNAVEHMQELALKKGVSIIMRDTRYAESLSRNPHAFISHDSRDKNDIARPIASSLRSLKLDVWYDEYSLNPGDSLRESIETGLKSCNKCIVVLTPNFLGKGGWSKREYDSVYTRELIEDRRVIIPIWCGVSSAEVYAYSPILADRFALNWDDLGLESICAKLHAELIRSTAET